MKEHSIWKADERASYLLRKLYRQHGYLPYHMSKFEEYDLYVRNKSFLVSDKILTFTDTDGRLMALKPDVTLSIVKNTPDSGESLHKVYYNEHVYRTSSAAAGYREIMQTGLECMGALDQLAVAEVIGLACRSLALIHHNYLLDLSHMGIVSGLIRDLEEDLQAGILTEMSRKNTGGIADLCRSAGIDPNLSNRLERLSALYGTADKVLPILRELSPDSETQEACSQLDELCQLLHVMGLDDHIRLDFSIVNDMNYYNGIIFRGYLPGLASGVLSGGRYDKLLEKMGKQGGAIGFAVYLDQLELLESPGPRYDADTLLLYTPADDLLQVSAMADKLRKQGVSVRIERSVPSEGRFKEILHFQGGQTSWR